MHLTKKGTAHIGNTYKYFSRDQALDRLESAIHYFLDTMGMRNLTHLSETYHEMSLKDKELYDAVYHIPLHVCSLFIPLIPLMAFYNGKHKNAVRTIACSVTVSLMMFMAIYPNLIYGSWNITNFFNDYFDFHTVFYHNVVIFEFILIVVLRLHHVGEGKHVRNMALLGAGFSVVAGVMSQILKTNYANFYTCNIGPVNDFVNSIKDAIGYAAGQTIYVVITKQSC